MVGACALISCFKWPQKLEFDWAEVAAYEMRSHFRRTREPNTNSNSQASRANRPMIATSEQTANSSHRNTKQTKANQAKAKQIDFGQTEANADDALQRDQRDRKARDRRLWANQTAHWPAISNTLAQPAIQIDLSASCTAQLTSSPVRARMCRELEFRSARFGESNNKWRPTTGSGQRNPTQFEARFDVRLPSTWGFAEA